MTLEGFACWAATAAGLLLLASSAAPAADRSGGRPAPDETHHRAMAPGGEDMELAPAPIPSDSLFQLESRWTTAEGGEIPLSALGGRIQVLAMIYTHCEHACPRIIADMRSIRRELGDTRGRVGYALVSLDPARDDAERLHRFAEKTGLGADWQLLRGDGGAVRELAAALGVRYRRVGDGDFVHSNLISILDPHGVVVYRQVGLGVDPAESVAVIRAQLARARSTDEAASP